MTTAIFVFLAASAWSFTVWIAYRIGVGIGLTAAAAATMDALADSLNRAGRDYEHNTDIN